MGRCTAVLVMLACWSSLFLPLAFAADGEGSAGASELFNRHRLWEAHIRVSAQAWKRMQMVRRERFAEPPPATQPDYQALRAGYFGHQYTYVRGTLEFNGEAFENVGIRFKGASSYDATKTSLKRPFKIDFNRFVDGKLFHGLREINLQNNACDPSQIRDALSYWVFNQAGIPTPRTTFVLLYLTIEGERDHVCLGVYTLVEEVDKRFLTDRFGGKQGLLLKPEAGRLPFHGNDWSQYSDYQPRKGGTDQESARIIELARVIHQESGDAFREQIAKLMDVDEYLKYLAVNVMIANLDGPLGINHNFILYAPPRGARVLWIPWDMNMAWGDYQRMGGWDELMDLSVQKPWTDGKALLEKVLAVKEWRVAYLGHIARLMRSSLSVEKIAAEVAAMEEVVREADLKSGGAITAGNPPDVPWTPSWRKPPSPARFAAGRWLSLARQLDHPSQTDGYIPRYRMGGMHDGPSFRAPASLAPTAAAFAIIDADGDGKLSQRELETAILSLLFARADRNAKPAIDRADVAAAIEDLKHGPYARTFPTKLPRVYRGDQPNAPSATILFEMDRNLDGKLVKSEGRATIARFIYEYDLNDDGQLDRQEFANLALRFLAGW
jgi:spore coat protein H